MHDTLEPLPKMQTAALEALESIAQMWRRIIRHGQRLYKYQAKLAQRLVLDGDDAQLKSKVGRAADLQARYIKIAADLRGLNEALEKAIEDNAKIARRIFMKDFSARLRQARKEADLTQNELAKRIGVKRSSYTAFETARNEPNASVVVAIAKELNKPVNWLLGT